jgi:hypothetical protein
MGGSSVERGKIQIITSRDRGSGDRESHGVQLKMFSCALKVGYGTFFPPLSGTLAAQVGGGKEKRRYLLKASWARS